MLDAHGAPRDVRSVYVSIQTNLKGSASTTPGAEATSEMSLEQFTAITDKWRSGKTRWLRAIEFAINGTLPGASTPKALFEQWAPEGATALFAYLTRADGQVFGVRVWRGEKGYEIAHTMPEDVRALPPSARARVMPLLSARSVITLGADLGRREMVLRFGEGASVVAPEVLGAEDRAAWAANVPLARAEVLANKKRGASGEPDAAEILVEMQKLFDQNQREASKRIKEFDQATTMVVPLAAGVEQLPALEAKAKLAAAWASSESLRRELEGARSRKTTLETAKAQQITQRAAWIDGASAREEGYFAPLIARHEEARRVANEKARALEETETRLEVSRALAGAASSAVQAARAGGHGGADARGACPLCAQQTLIVQMYETLGQNVEGLAASLRTERASWQAAVGVADGLATELAGARKQAADYEAQIAQSLAAADAEISSLTARISALEEHIRTMGAAQPYTGPEEAVLRQQIRDLVGAAEARRAYEKKLSEKSAVEAQRESFTRLKKAAKETLTKLVDAAAYRAEALTAALLGGSLSVRFNRDDYCWEVLGSDQRWHDRHTACGDELTWLTLAVAVAYTSETPNRLVLLDGADLGEMNPSILALLERVPDLQVVLAWTRPDEVPACFARRDARGVGAVPTRAQIERAVESGETLTGEMARAVRREIAALVATHDASLAAPPPPAVLLAPPPPPPPPAGLRFVPLGDGWRGNE